MDIKSIGPHSLNIDKNMTVGQSPRSGKAFMETLKESLSQVNHLQKEADIAVNDLVSGKDQEIHQTMIAVEKADISFQLMMQVRNKILRAYEEISRMQV